MALSNFRLLNAVDALFRITHTVNFRYYFCPFWKPQRKKDSTTASKDTNFNMEIVMFFSLRNVLEIDLSM